MTPLALVDIIIDTALALGCAAACAGIHFEMPPPCGLINDGQYLPRPCVRRVDDAG